MILVRCGSATDAAPPLATIRHRVLEMLGGRPAGQTHLRGSRAYEVSYALLLRMRDQWQLLYRVTASSGCGGCLPKCAAGLFLERCAMWRNRARCFWYSKGVDKQRRGGDRLRCAVLRDGWQKANHVAS